MALREKVLSFWLRTIEGISDIVGLMVVTIWTAMGIHILEIMYYTELRNQAILNYLTILLERITNMLLTNLV